MIVVNIFSEPYPSPISLHRLKRQGIFANVNRKEDKTIIGVATF